jgi:hypothetical protein
MQAFCRPYCILQEPLTMCAQGAHFQCGNKPNWGEKLSSILGGHPKPAINRHLKTGY